MAGPILDGGGDEKLGLLNIASKAESFCQHQAKTRFQSVRNLQPVVPGWITATLWSNFS